MGNFFAQSGGQEDSAGRETKYNSPYWDDVAVSAAKEVGIAPELLLAIKNHGEKSNADQVSSAGARTPFQIIPGTRDAFLRKYGVDAYADDESAAKVAALHLKESLDRGNNVDGAVREYHGGPDRSRWGAVNAAYGARVARGMGAAEDRGEVIPAASSDNFFAQDGTPRKGGKNFFAEFESPKATLAPNEFDKGGGSGDYLDAIGKGFSGLKDSMFAAKWMLGGGDSAGVARALAEQLNDNRASAGEREIQQSAQGVDDAKGGVDTAKAIGSLLWSFASNPYDSGKMIAQNLPNAVPSMVFGAAGAAAGGAILPGAGMIVGGLTGLGAGSAAVEFGAKLSDTVQDALKARTLPATQENIQAILDEPGFREKAQGEGAAKGLTIGAIDALSAAIGGRIATAPFRQASRRVLERQGVDLADSAAVNSALRTAPVQAALKAEMAAIPLSSKVGMGGAGVAFDSAMEGVGEYSGEYAATGQGKLGDAILEGVTSLGQSAVQVAGSAALQSGRGMIGAESVQRADIAARQQAIRDIARAPDVDSAVDAFNRSTAPNPDLTAARTLDPVEFDRLGALGLINASGATAPELVGPQHPLGDPNTIPYDYSTLAQRFPQLPAPEMATGSGTLINDTDSQLTRPEQFGDREARINVSQRAREELADAPGLRDIAQTADGPTRRPRVTLDETGNVVDAAPADRQFLAMVRRDGRAHAAAAIDAHSINPALVEAALAAPNMGPKAERVIFEAITNGTVNAPETIAILATNGIDGRLANPNGQGAQPVTSAALDRQQESAASSTGDSGSQGVVAAVRRGPFQIRGKWPHDMSGGALAIIAKNSKNTMIERATASAEMDRRNPTRALDKSTATARRDFRRTIIDAGGVSEKEAADIGIDPRSLGGYRMPRLITKNGMRIDELAILLKEAGYLTEAQVKEDGANLARLKFADLLAHEFVGTTDQENNHFDLLSEHHAAGNIDASGFDALSEIEKRDVADYDDSVVADESTDFAVDLDATTNMSEAAAMRALGFTEKEISDVERSTKTAAIGAAVASIARQDESGGPPSSGAPGDEQTKGSESAAHLNGGDQQGAEAVVASPAAAPAFDLNAQTPVELAARAKVKQEAEAARQREADNADRRERAAKIKKEVDEREALVRKERADAAVAGFALGQKPPEKAVSDDQAAGQGDVFDSPPKAITIDDVPPAMLRRVKITVEQLHGNKVESVEVSAADAIKDIDDEIGAYQKLLACVRAA